MARPAFKRILTRIIPEPAERSTYVLASSLALIALFLGIMQLPASIVSIPAIIWLWNSGDGGTVMNVVWTVYLIVAGLADNVLKPVLLGRGVDAPMPVILIGALGGMISSGFIGLFTGAVTLAVGHQIFMRWVEWQEEGAEAAAGGDTEPPDDNAGEAEATE